MMEEYVMTQNRVSIPIIIQRCPTLIRKTEEILRKDTWVQPEVLQTKPNTEWGNSTSQYISRLLEQQDARRAAHLLTSPSNFNKKKQVSDIKYLVLAQEPPVLFNCIMGSIYFIICLGDSINLLPCFTGKYVLNSYLRYLQFSSVQFSSVAQSCPTLCNPMIHSTPGLPVHHHLPEFTQTQVHRVHNAIHSTFMLGLIIRIRWQGLKIKSMGFGAREIFRL